MSDYWVLWISWRVLKKADLRGEEHYLFVLSQHTRGLTTAFGAREVQCDEKLISLSDWLEFRLF